MIESRSFGKEVIFMIFIEGECKLLTTRVQSEENNSTEFSPY